jgi:hypothetical protein
MAHSGTPRRGNTVSITWISSQATTAYVAATLGTFRRFNSLKNDINHLYFYVGKRPEAYADLQQIAEPM